MSKGNSVQTVESYSQQGRSLLEKRVASAPHLAEPAPVRPPRNSHNLNELTETCMPTQSHVEKWEYTKIETVTRVPEIAQKKQQTCRITTYQHLLLIGTITVCSIRTSCPIRRILSDGLQLSAPNVGRRQLRTFYCAS